MSHDIEPSSDPLVWQALLYAVGELEPATEAEFENRLAGDQQARESLCHAAQLLAAMDVIAPLRPNPEYRQAVRARLHSKDWNSKPAGSPRSRLAHALFWSFSGAAAAILLMLSSDQGARMAHLPKLEAGSTVASIPADVSFGDHPELLEEAANTWAALHPSDHLHKAHDDEARRRWRAWEKYHHGRPEERSRYEHPTKPM